MTPADRLNSITEYYFATKLAQIHRMNLDGGPRVLNLGIGSPDLFPPADVIRALKEGLEEKTAHMYQPYKGNDFFREAIATWYHRWFDVALNPETNILPLQGSKEGIMHISMAFINPGDRVLVPDPGYPSYRSCTLLAGGTPVEMALTEKTKWRPDLDALDKTDLSNVRLMWLNYPNMPTGAKADRGFFNDAVSFARRHGILLCHDNPYAFLLNDHPLSALQADESLDHVLELTSLSKCYNMAGWRIGAVCGGAAHLQAVMTYRSQMDSGMFLPIQRAASTAMAMSSDWFKDINALYAERKKVGVRILNYLECEVNGDWAGLFLWGKCHSSFSTADDLSEQLLQRCRVFITPGHVFGSEGTRFLRLSLCSPVSDLEEALMRIQSDEIFSPEI